VTDVEGFDGHEGNGQGEKREKVREPSLKELEKVDRLPGASPQQGFAAQRDDDEPPRQQEITDLSGPDSDLRVG